MEAKDQQSDEGRLEHPEIGKLAGDGHDQFWNRPRRGWQKRQRRCKPARSKFAGHITAAMFPQVFESFHRGAPENTADELDKARQGQRKPEYRQSQPYHPQLVGHSRLLAKVDDALVDQPFRSKPVRRQDARNG